MGELDLPRWRRLVLLGAALLGAAFAACSSGGDDGDATASVCDASVSEVQDLVSVVVKQVPGFAGCAPDPENSGGYIVNITSNDVDLEAARAAIIAHDASQSEALGGADLRPVMLHLSEIYLWYQEAHNKLLTELPEEHKPEWGWHYADFDELHNQGIFAYATEEQRAWAQDLLLTEIDAPPGSLVAIQKEPGQDD